MLKRARRHQSVQLLRQPLCHERDRLLPYPELPVDANADGALTVSSALAHQGTARHPERLILIYWLCATGLGLLLLWDWLSAWRVPATLSTIWLPIYLVGSFALSQLLYLLVARHDGRPIPWRATVLFALGNGLAETLAFAGIYRLGAALGTVLVGFVAPAFASLGGFVVGVGCFIIYGGLIHGLFWLRVLPPHLSDTPQARQIRKLRPLAEVGLVLGWSLCFWLMGDIWTVVFFHILVDLGLMLKVRPQLFVRTAQA